jgi:hypothetical protein
MRFVFLILALLMFFAWIGAFLVFHIAGGLIHIFLLLAIILFVVHLARGYRTVP